VIRPLLVEDVIILDKIVSGWRMIKSEGVEKPLERPFVILTPPLAGEESNNFQHVKK
jgi:hypothetical protein